MTQQGDVKLFNTDDGGEIEVANGLFTMSSGLETAAYLSLFGGNFDDPGGDDRRLDWWGNIDETEPARRYRSETQYLLRSIPATSANLLRIEQAAARDLAWFIEVGAASSVDVFASIPGLNRVKIVVTIKAEGDETTFEYSENWRAAA